MKYEIMIKRRLGLLTEYIDKNIVDSNTSLKGGDYSVGVFYTMVVDYTVMDFLFVCEFREISANDAFEIREIITNLIETKYKDKIISSYCP